MKLKDHSWLQESGRRIWPPHWGFQQSKYGREHPNSKREEFARQATINSAIERHDLCGVILHVNHPKYAREIVIGTLWFPHDTPANRKLARNLAKVVEGFRGKTVEELGECEVSDYLDIK
jgi:hypothetical protein